MSVIQMRFLSETLNMYTPVNIILPLPRNAKTSVQDLPMLILLHGMGDGYSAWLRKTSIERYALEYGVAIVMPDGELSCYENMVHGHHYRDYITLELPKLIQDTFPVSSDREKNFIAGCTMGGFGALKLGLSCPEKWSVIGCFSAAHFEYRPPSARHQEMLARAYGNQLEEYEAHIIADAKSVNNGKFPLHIWHSCGDEDALKTNALITRDFFDKMPEGALDYHFEQLIGHHDWALWDESVHRFMKYLNLPKPEGRLL